MKRFRTHIISVLAITLLLSAKFLFFPQEKVKAAAPGKEAKKPATPVTVFVIGKEKLDNKLFTSGTILANKEAELITETNGRIVYVNFAEGKAVKEGTLLVKINDAELQSQLNKVKAQLKLAKEAESRQRKLLDIEGTSRHEHETALSGLHMLKADSAFYQAQIAKTELRAPFDGLLGLSDIHKGNYVSPATALAKIRQINPVKLDFSLPEKYSSLIGPGNTVQFYTESYPEIFSARITLRDPQVDLASRSVRYRAVCNNPKGKLLPGSFANVEIRLKESGPGLFVPTEAIVPVQKGKKVFIVKEGKAEEKLVITGIRSDDYVQVLSGLQAGDSVVVNGNFQLKTGASVKVSGKKKL